MTKPARQNHQATIYRLQRRQIWAVLVLIVVAIGIEALGVAHATKSVALGSLLAYLAQSVFTALAYRAAKGSAGRIIMLNMYFGQMVKWLFTLVGFALIFIAVKPLNTLFVLLGYFVMQIVHIIVMWRTH